MDINTLARQVAELFESKGFSDIRATFSGSVYGNPKPILGTAPTVTGLSATHRFYIATIESDVKPTNELYTKRLHAFTTHIKKHGGTLWIFVPKGTKQQVEKYCKEVDILSYIELIKES